MSQLTRKITTFDSALSLALLLFSTPVVLFYQADYLIGAIGLRVSYFISGLILAFFFLVTAISLFALYKVIPTWLAIGLNCFLLVGLAAMNVRWLFLGWFAAVLIALIPPVLIVVIFCAALATWIWANFRASPPNVQVMRYIAVSCSTLMAIYVLGVGSLPEHAEFDSHGSVSLNNRHYFLHLYWGWLGDPDTLILYECNQFGLLCAEVYSTSDSYRDKQIELVPEVDANTLVIRIKGTPHYVYRPTDG